jgi:hypothetical protein
MAVYSIIQVGLSFSVFDYWDMAGLNILCFTGLTVFLQKVWKIGSRQVDSKYYKPTMDELLTSARYAHDQMKQTDWKLSNNVYRWRDCDDYAERMCTLMKEWFYINVGDQHGLGLGIAPFSFIRKDKKGHVCVECYVKKGKSVFFDCWPNQDGEYKLKSSEIKNADWTNF